MAKKEPINVTPPETTGPIINTDRVKVVIMFNGDNIIADVQEAVDKDSGARQAYILNFPYKVQYEQPELSGTGLITNPEVKVNYSPWCPLTPENRIPVNHNMVVTILEPVPSLRDTYITNVRQMGGNVE